MSDIYTDEIGRMFCKDHRKVHCNICCMSFDIQNKHAEIAAGLRRPPSKAEELANQKVMIERGLAFMANQTNPATRRHMRENVLFHQTELARVERELQDLLNEDEDQLPEYQRAFQEELEKAQSNDVDQRAMAEAFARLNPGKTEFEMGGEETEQIYQKFVAPPPSAQRDAALDPYTCSYCKKISTTKLLACGRCKKQAYCSPECQRPHWKAHKKECKRVEQLTDEETKMMPLTWKQLEEFSNAPGKELEVRFVTDRPGMLRQIAVCKDRVGISKTVAFYNTSKCLPGFVQGKIMVWKNPRFHYFADGTNGARIEESDLINIRIKD